MPGRINSYAVALSLSLAASMFACNSAPADLRPWRATDHDHTANPNAGQVQVTDAGTATSKLGLDEVTIVAWQQNCITCHGQLGRGDGPQGQLVHASDLSRPDWQASVTDEAIAATIRQGRGRMPAFNLPESTLTRLVALIRMLDLNRMQRGGAAGPEASGSAPPAHPTAAAAGSAAAPQRAGR